MTKVQAYNLFMEAYAELEKSDRKYAWLDFTDSLCKDGDITQNQYNRWVNPFS